MAKKTTTLNIRINPELKTSAEALYNKFGITISDAVNMFLSKSLMENGLPFELKQPRYNEETEAAMKEGKQIAADMLSGKAQGYSSFADMLGDLNA